MPLIKPTVSLEVVYLIYANNFMIQDKAKTLLKEFINFKALLYRCSVRLCKKKKKDRRNLINY